MARIPFDQLPEDARVWIFAAERPLTDVVVGISVHGGVGKDSAGPWSQNVLAALRWANEHGGHSLGLVGFDGGAMADLCTAVVVVPVESTPHTEGLHVVVHHLVTTQLRQRIEKLGAAASPPLYGRVLSAGM